ncbi:hypothetical protein ABZO31_28655 [Streptomyces sp. HUAS MG47]|uniref:preprotein translocase subunit SecY n=1 Tax=Streptomyces solicamelliae TaxID=3231716 RepID=UPI003877B5EA
MLVRLWRSPDLRRRLLVTLAVLVLFRLGQNLPLPGADAAARDRAADLAGGAGPWRGLAELLTGGGVSRLSVFTFGVLPAVAATFLTAMAGLLVPRLAALAELGPEGHARIARLGRLVAVLLSAAAGVALSYRVFPDAGLLARAAVIAALAAGTALVLLLAGWIRLRGFGEGLSVLLLAQLAAVFPGQVRDAAREAGGGAAYAVVPLVVVAALVAMTVAVLVVRQSVRRVPVQAARRMVGRRAYGGQQEYLPIRGGQGGYAMAVPASLLLALPAPGSGWYAAACAAYVLLVVGHAFLRAGTDLDAEEAALALKRDGRFVPGIRPGAHTIDYLVYLQKRIGFAAALLMGVVALIPVGVVALLGGYGADAPFGVTALLIVASVAAGTALPAVRQMDSRPAQETYAPLLR